MEFGAWNLEIILKGRAYQHHYGTF